jgi:hypothetical protein
MSDDELARSEILEACAIAGYEVRAKKTGSPKWGYREESCHRRYREIATAAIEMYEQLTRIDREAAARAAFDAFWCEGTPYNEIERAMFLQVVDAIVGPSA